MELPGKKLGVLISSKPEEPGFGHGIRLAETAQDQGVRVYLYCIDEAVRGVGDPRLQALKSKGIYLYACAFAAERYQVPLSDAAIFSGLASVSDILANTDRFVSFN